MTYATEDFAKYQRWCTDMGKRWTWRGFAEWLRREAEKQKPKQGNLFTKKGKNDGV